MSEKADGKVVFYRSKGDQIGALAVGCLLLGIAVPSMSLESVGGIRISRDLMVMSTYLALPLSVVLILANVRHVFDRGPTVAADKNGVTLLFTDPPAGPFPWAEIKGFMVFRRQGKRHLGITFEDPYLTLTPFKGTLAPMIKSRGPKAAHLKIDGKMVDSNIKQVVADLEEQLQIYSWRR
jgi:hypothetical protein